MKKTALTTLLVAASFFLGFAFNAIIADDATQAPPLKRVTGIGGRFKFCIEAKD